MLRLSSFYCSVFPVAGYGSCSFTWHCRNHVCFQFSPCILDDVFVFFITWINRINTPQTSGILEFGLFECPLLIFFSLSGFSNSCPSFRPFLIWTCRRLNVCQSPTGPHTSFWRCLFQSIKFREKLSTNLTNFCFHRRSNNHQFFFFLCNVQI